MTAAQAQEARDRLNVHFQDVCAFYEDNGCEAKSLGKLRAVQEAFARAEPNSHFGFLELVEGYSRCMAFMDHDALAVKIAQGWTGVEQFLLIDKKALNRKLKILEEDKKSDPEVIAKLHAKKDAIDLDLARVLVQVIKCNLINSIPIEKFYDKSYNAMAERDKAILAKREAAA
jgi:hypothetical protein